MEITHEITDIVSASDYTPNSTDFEFAEVLVKLDGYGYYLEVRRGMDDSSFLYWTDGMVNEWCEHYDKLSEALARLSILLEAMEEQRFFNNQPTQFVRSYKAFAEKEIV